MTQSAWKPTFKEKNALDKHNHVTCLDRIEQIWPWLSSNHGDIAAVVSPYTFHPEKYNYKELAKKISDAASSFCSLGVQQGDVVALFAENSPRWLIADQGLMQAGACDAVRGASAPPEELRYILSDSQSVGLIVQSSQLWEDLALNDDEKKQLKFVLQLEGEPCKGVMGWEEFLNCSEVQKTPQRAINQKIESSIATILYTSGTTGRPKGVPLTHENLLHQMRSLACVAYPSPGSPILSVLPIWHAYERSAEYYFFSCACTQHYTTKKFLKEDLQKIRPIVMATVPRLWEAVQSGFDEAIKKMPLGRQKFIKAALVNSGAFKLALRRFRGLMIEKVTIKQRIFSLGVIALRFPFHWIASLLLWPKVLAQLSGGRLRFPINGGGAIAPHVDLFFEALGVELLVGYGLTETSPVVSCRRPWRNIRGTSGTPLPATEFKIVDPDSRVPLDFREQGCVLVRGPQVMKGYLNKPEATQKVLDADGWFDTGDLGMLLPDGSIVLTGRAKDTIVLSSGENIEPGPLEEAIVSSPLIDQVLVIGQDEKQLGALLVPNLEKIKIFAKDQGLYFQEPFETSNGDKELRKVLRTKVNAILQSRQGSRSDERVVGVAFVQPFTIENGLLTQTLKQKRDKIRERDSLAVALIYGR